MKQLITLTVTLLLLACLDGAEPSGENPSPFSPAAPVQGRLQGPPAKSKFLAVSKSVKFSLAGCP